MFNSQTSLPEAQHLFITRNVRAYQFKIKVNLVNSLMIALHFLRTFDKKNRNFLLQFVLMPDRDTTVYSGMTAPSNLTDTQDPYLYMK